MDNSSFSNIHIDLHEKDLLPVGGATCDCYRVRLYGKQHFLKVLKPHLRTNPRYAAAMEKEFETGFNLDHPHLVRYVFKTDDGILMEYVDGLTLSEFVVTQPDYFRNRENADRFLRELLDVVGYLHQHQIVHLDLKPENILITRIGHDVKLIDLGFCYTDTYTDTMGRTDKYAAPEQLNGNEKVDARTDIYAIGRILQTLPCAQRYKKVIARCIAEDKERRFQNVGEVIALTSRRGKRMWWMVAAMLLFVAALAFLLMPKQGKMEIAQQPEAVGKDSQVTQTATPPPQESALPAIDQIEVNPSTTMASTKPDEPIIPKEVEDLFAHQDTVALRKELQALTKPYFDKILAVYQDSSYQETKERLSKKYDKEYRPAVLEQYYKLWEKYRKAGTVAESTFFNECLETLQYFWSNLVYKMKLNDGDESYRGKTYQYYDSRKKGSKG